MNKTTDFYAVSKKQIRNTKKYMLLSGVIIGVLGLSLGNHYAPVVHDKLANLNEKHEVAKIKEMYDEEGHELLGYGLDKNGDYQFYYTYSSYGITSEYIDVYNVDDDGNLTKDYDQSECIKASDTSGRYTILGIDMVELGQ